MRRLFFLMLPVLAIAVSCGGVAPDGDLTGEGPGGSQTAAFRFVADAGNPGGANNVAMGSISSAGNLVTLGVVISDTNDLFGASMDVVFDAGSLEFVDWAAGGLLESGGESVSYQLSTSQPGRVVIGVSRTGGAPGVDVVGSGNLIHLTFRALAGPSDLAFDNASLLDSQSPPQQIPSVSWFGGSMLEN